MNEKPSRPTSPATSSLSRRLALGAATAAVFAGLAGFGSVNAQQKMQLQFWHGFTGTLAQQLEAVVAGFNASQNQYQVVPSNKGTYPETMVAAIASFRSGNPPHIVQMFEVGTATMMNARGAIKPVQELMKEAGIPFDPKAFIGPVRGYYSTLEGEMLSMPFNSSTPVMWYNKDAFKKAGLDPNKPPKTWQELRAAATKIKAANAAPCAYSTAWPTWIQFENFAAIHNIPLATKNNGMGGTDVALRLSDPLFQRHTQTLVDMHKEGTFKYGGRDSRGDSLFATGECAIVTASSGLRSGVIRDAKFDWGVAPLPYYSDVRGAPRNSIIGGASLWVMASPRRTAEEYKGVAEFFRYINQPEVAAKWHQDTGYVPLTTAVYERTKASGFYDKNPGTEIPILQMTRTELSPNTMGVRLGNFQEIRTIMQEELERAFNGQLTVKQALANMVTRGNKVLRDFDRANRAR
ncbi:MAG TPA: sn-glycerol-3-phosphate ABC transporter substrate-binding protein UgpB [Deinococcales bacterium]|nr:sn-glycerol-3-phosphate ABC transporter substrate-binding protein UgpB [Deinococcales bacterium]